MSYVNYAKRKVVGPKRDYKKNSSSYNADDMKKMRSVIKREVTQELSRAVETKGAQVRNLDIVLRGASDAAYWQNNIISLGFDSASSNGGIPINQGVTENTRVGDRVAVKKLMFKGSIYPLAYNATTNQGPTPTTLKVWFYYDKTDPTAAQGAAFTDFFRYNNANTGFLNDLADLWMPINTDKYEIVKTHTWKVGNSNYEVGAGANAPSAYFANNDYLLQNNFSFDLTKFYPKIVKWDGNQTPPLTRRLFAFFMPFNANGTPILSGTWPVGMSYVNMIEYTDM